MQINPRLILWIRAAMRPDGLSLRDDDGPQGLNGTNSVTTAVCSHKLGYCATPEDNQATVAMIPSLFANHGVRSAIYSYHEDEDDELHSDRISTRSLLRFLLLACPLVASPPLERT